MGDVFEFIGLALLFIGVLFLIQLFYAWIAKVGNVNIVSRRGTKIATPKDFDENIEALNNYKNDIKSFILKSINSLNKDDRTVKGISEKLKLINELEELRLKNVISESEFLVLKNQIIEMI
jgi:hypothetical protein